MATASGNDRQTISALPNARSKHCPQSGKRRDSAQHRRHVLLDDDNLRKFQRLQLAEHRVQIGMARGEDTLQTHAFLRAAADSGFGIARLRGAGWCYIYTFYGSNVWEGQHHRAISALKGLPAARLLPRLQKSRQVLAEYRPNLPALHMRVGSDSVWVT
jgi:hypothetical protein